MCIRAWFRDDAGGEAEVLRGAGHGTTHGGHAHDGDAVAAGGVHQIREVLEGLALVGAADEDLHSEDAGVEADGFFDVERGALIGEGLKAGAGKLGFLAVDLAFPLFHRADHRGAAGGAQGNGLGGGGRNDGTLDAAGEHEAVGVGCQGEDGLVHALQAGGPVSYTHLRGNRTGKSVRLKMF